VCISTSHISRGTAATVAGMGIIVGALHHGNTKGIYKTHTCDQGSEELAPAALRALSAAGLNDENLACMAQSGILQRCVALVPLLSPSAEVAHPRGVEPPAPGPLREPSVPRSLEAVREPLVTLLQSFSTNPALLPTLAAALAQGSAGDNPAAAGTGVGSAGNRNSQQRERSDAPGTDSPDPAMVSCQDVAEEDGSDPAHLDNTGKTSVPSCPTDSCDGVEPDTLASSDTSRSTMRAAGRLDGDGSCVSKDTEGGPGTKSGLWALFGMLRNAHPGAVTWCGGS
jgi:hypothetical protein